MNILLTLKSIFWFWHLLTFFVFCVNFHLNYLEGIAGIQRIISNKKKKESSKLLNLVKSCDRTYRKKIWVGSRSSLLCEKNRPFESTHHLVINRFTKTFDFLFWAVVYFRVVNFVCKSLVERVTIDYFQKY